MCVVLRRSFKGFRVAVSRCVSAALPTGFPARQNCRLFRVSRAGPSRPGDYKITAETKATECCTIARIYIRPSFRVELDVFLKYSGKFNERYRDENYS